MSSRGHWSTAPRAICGCHVILTVGPVSLFGWWCVRSSMSGNKLLLRTMLSYIVHNTTKSLKHHE